MATICLQMKCRRSPYTFAMSLIRTATVDDADLIAQQRRRMFVDAGQPDDARMHSMEKAFIPWVRTRRLTSASIRTRTLP